MKGESMIYGEDKRCGECKTLHRSCPSETVTWEAEAVVSDLESTGSYSREEAGENLARLNARVRELEASLRDAKVLSDIEEIRLSGWVKSLRQQLRTMTEDRDKETTRILNLERDLEIITDNSDEWCAKTRQLEADVRRETARANSLDDWANREHALAVSEAQKLKTMTEDRDEFQQQLENCRASNQSVLADNRRMRQELLELHHLEQRRLMGLPKKNPWATLEAGDVDHESFSEPSEEPKWWKDER